MSTFKGVVEEFPEIRIDYFRQIAGKRPPLACFLSHVHSDHLLGLECPGGPFIYCSPATKELLVRLEKYHHRMNFEKGILESRKQQYKHLRNRLKTIPLNTPTDIELTLGNFIRVTLLDANHCAGAVMFLIEDHSKAILYTGDIRSEPWWVHSLIRNPVVIPYSHGQKRLGKIYLDTTFATKKDLYRRFPTKSAGIAELLEKVSRYPKDTTFHFNAWTLGYEDVWVALSATLRSQIHVDQYKSRLYRSLASITAGKNNSYEGSALFGFPFGHQDQAGCLTSDQNVRLHSCERGSNCATLDEADVVYITPIISRTAAGQVVPEVGAGGGGGDLIQSHDLELNDLEEGGLEKLIDLCKKNIVDHEARLNTVGIISKAKLSKTGAVSLDTLEPKLGERNIPLDELAQLLAKLGNENVDVSPSESSLKKYKGENEELNYAHRKGFLSRRIEFPYSRHSSYEELCLLVSAFKPLDIYPCTVDEDTWGWNMSIQSLFGHLCSGTTFAHDKEMEHLLASRSIATQRQKDQRQSHIMMSSREASIEPSWRQASGTNSANVFQSLLDQPYHTDYSDGADRATKRRRSSSPFTGYGQRAIKPDKAESSTEGLSNESTLQEIRQSFGTYRKQSNQSTVPTPAATNPIPLATNGEPAVESGASSRDARKPPPGTKAEPIELSDGVSSYTNGNDDDDAGVFLLDEITEPKSFQNSPNSGGSDLESQLSLSTTAFESQGSHRPQKDTDKAKVKHRKEAYKAARELSGGWEVEHSLVSSRASHVEEELEL